MSKLRVISNDGEIAVVRLLRMLRGKRESVTIERAECVIDGKTVPTVEEFKAMRIGRLYDYVE